MKDVFQATFNEFKDTAVIFSDESSAAQFISNSGATSCFPVVGFCAGYFDNGEKEIDKRWRQYLEAVKFGKKIVIMMRTLDGGSECVKPMTKKDHDEFTAS